MPLDEWNKYAKEEKERKAKKLAKIFIVFCFLLVSIPTLSFLFQCKIFMDCVIVGAAAGVLWVFAWIWVDLFWSKDKDHYG